MNDNPFLDLDRILIGDIYTSEEPQRNLDVLCDDLDSRFAGSALEHQAADYLVAQLTAYGLQSVRKERVEYEGWTRGAATLEVIAPVQRSVACISLPHSPAGTVEADLVDLGAGAPALFEVRRGELAGAVVMANSEVRPAGAERWIHRNEKYGRAAIAGAAAFIFVNHYPGFGPVTGGIGHANGGAPLPGIGLSLENGALLQRLLQRYGTLRVRLTTTDELHPVHSWNVLADLPGSGASDDLVILGSHYDGHDIAQGATDPASGTVAVLEAARVLARYAPALPCSVRFAFWGAEEIGLIGSERYVVDHAAELDRIRFYFNMDAAGAVPEKGVNLNEWPELAPLFERWAREMALEVPVGQSVNAHSDHYPFLLAGVPTGGMEPVKLIRSGRGYGHTRYDTLDKVEVRGVREAAALAARLAVRVASTEKWPVRRRSPQAVQAIFAANAQYQEERSFWDEYDAFYRAARKR